MPSTAMPPSQVRASHQLGDVLLEARHGDICHEDVGAIVNAANEALRHGGGVAKAISTAAGHDDIVQRESTEWVREHGPVHTGRVAAITSAGALPCKHVVHVTGPIWRQRVETLNEIEVRGEVTAVEDGTGGVRRATLMTAECGTVTFDCFRAAPGYVPQAGDRVRALVSKPAPAPPGAKGGKKQHTVRFACGTKHAIQQSDEELLAGAVMAALRKADEVGCKSVALPAISSGIFGFPLDLCAKILVECGVAFARERPLHITRIAYTNIDSKTVTALVNAFAAAFGPQSPDAAAAAAAAAAARPLENAQGRPLTGPLLVTCDAAGNVVDKAPCPPTTAANVAKMKAEGYLFHASGTWRNNWVRGLAPPADDLARQAQVVAPRGDSGCVYVHLYVWMYVYRSIDRSINLSIYQSINQSI